MSYRPSDRQCSQNVKIFLKKKNWEKIEVHLNTPNYIEIEFESTSKFGMGIIKQRDKQEIS